jgi:hypothetical protein
MVNVYVEMAIVYVGMVIVYAEIAVVYVEVVIAMPKWLLCMLAWYLWFCAPSDCEGKGRESRCVRLFRLNQGRCWLSPIILPAAAKVAAFRLSHRGLRGG